MKINFRFIKKRNWVFLISIFTINFMYLTPDKKQWMDAIYQKFPVVKYKVNPTMIGFNTGETGSILDAIRKASDYWSFQSGESHFQFSYNGTTTNKPLSYEEIACTPEGKDSLRNRDNLVFATNTEDSDCSGQACTYIWSCNDSNRANSPSEILHFDTEINAKEYEWDTETNHKKSFNLSTVIAKQFGQILGLDHCETGLSVDACSIEAIARGTSNPSSDSLLYRFIDAEIIRSSLSADDKAGLQSLYGRISPEEAIMKSEMNSFYSLADSICNPNPCVIPEEDIGKYQLSTLKDYNDGLAGNRRIPTRGTFEKNLSPEFVYQFNPTAVQHMYINIVNKAANVHDSLTKLKINVESLSASNNGSSSFVLNRMPTQFEVLQLRNGYVGLAGANQIEAGNYEYFELALARTHTAEITGGVSVPLYMDEASQNIFRYYGPFVLRGGETFETYLHLDPNRSVYFTKDRGFVIDPTLTLVSTISMNPSEEETKIINSAGKFMNILASESDVVIRGSVTSVIPTVVANSSGRTLIYSDVVVNVTKTLKGNVALAPFSFRVLGGTVGNVKLEVSTAPVFKNGEEIILYLQKQKNGVSWKVTRGELGKVKL